MEDAPGVTAATELTFASRVNFSEKDWNIGPLTRLIVFTAPSALAARPLP